MLEEKMVSETAALGEYLAGLTFEQLPEEVVREAKFRLGDFLGIALSATKTPLAEEIRKFILDKGKAGKSSIWGTGKTIDPLYAAVANASITFHLELDDVHRTSHSHPGVCTIPAAMAICQDRGPTGKELLTAIVTGYDAVIRVGLSVSPSIYIHRIFMAPSTIGAIGSAATAAKLYGLDAAGITGAIANASYLGALAPHENYKQGTSVKEFIAGWCNLNGISSSDLSAYGFRGADTALQGNLGFCKAVSREYDTSKITKDFGKVYHILGTGTKPYACCRQHHSAIDCALEIRNGCGVKPEDVKSIKVRTFTVATRATAKTFNSIAAAKYSIPYAVSVALIFGNAWRSEYSEELLTDPRILSLAEKVSVFADEEMDKIYDEKWPAEVEITTNDGKVFTVRRDLMKGEPEYALSEQELKEKFMSLAVDAVPAERAEELWSMIMHVDEMDDLSPLFDVLK